jgi:outer membrane receptor protein involved in Fe transport
MSLFGRGFTTDGYRDRANYDAGSGRGSLEVELGERVTVGVGGGYYTDDRKLPGTLFRSEIEMDGRRSSSDRLSDSSEIDRYNVQGWIDAILAEDVVLRIKPHYHDRDEDVVITFLGISTSIVADKDAAGVDVQLQVDRKLGPMKNRLIVGGEFLHEETSRDITTGDVFPPLFTRSRQNTYGVFLQDELNLTDDLLLSAGFRFDYADYKLRAFDFDSDETDRPDFDIWSPKAALTYRVLPSVSIYGIYARGFRLPNFDENTPILPFISPPFPADPALIPDLDVQRSHTFEGGIKYETDLIQASVSGYHMRVKDELIGLFLNAFTFANVNLDRVIHNGVETAFRIQLVEWLTVYGSYTYEDVKIRKADASFLEDERMPINPIHRGTVGLFARLPYWFEVGYNANIIGERLLSNDFAHESPRLDSYATHDMHIAFRPELGDHVDGSISFAIRNLSEEEYSEFGARSATFPPPLFEPVFAESFFPAPKRTWEVGFVLTVRR